MGENNEEDSEEETEESDMDYDSNIESNDEEEEYEERCPPDCDSALWAQILDLRDKKLDQEEKIVEVQKVVDVCS
jgi:hypothetical protein